MNRKELTKTFVMISNWKKTFDRHVFSQKYFTASRVKPARIELPTFNVNYLQFKGDSSNCLLVKWAVTVVCLCAANWRTLNQHIDWRVNAPLMVGWIYLTETVQITPGQTFDPLLIRQDMIKAGEYKQTAERSVQAVKPRLPLIDEREKTA